MKYLISLLTALLVIPALTSRADGKSRLIEYIEGVNAVADTTISLPAFHQGASAGIVECRAAILNDRPLQGLSSRSWGLVIARDYTVSITSGNISLDDIVNEPYCLIAVTRGDSVMASAKITRDVATMPRRYNTLIAALDKSGKVAISVGNTIPKPVLDVKLPVNPLSEPPQLTVCGQIDVSTLVAETIVEPVALIECLPPDSLSILLKRVAGSANPVEGVWDFLDRDTDNSMARQGGRYSLLSVAGEDGNIDILYLGGAVVNAQSWRPGMKKGRLRPTIFNQSYELDWTDATGESMGPDCHATIEQGAILTLNFPLYKSSLRFSRRPAQK